MRLQPKKGNLEQEQVLGTNVAQKGVYICLYMALFSSNFTVNIYVCDHDNRNTVQTNSTTSSQGEWTRNSRFVAPNLRGAVAPS